MELLKKIIISGTNKDLTPYVLSGILTPIEISELERRAMIGILLIRNFSYIEIEKELGVSSTTIAKVASTLKENKGYLEILNSIMSS